MAERHPESARAADDWYVEPAWCVDILLRRGPIMGSLHDPCCGFGTIPNRARELGILATGADLRSRAPGWPVVDFFSDHTAHENIVTNPPYNIAVKIIEHALAHTQTSGYVCALVQAKFLFSQKRKPLFDRAEMERVIILSRRPSMPPGEALLEHGEAIRGGGSIDFCWAVWRVGKISGAPVIKWAM